jgi:DNA-binding response OmpR family regulator
MGLTPSAQTLPVALVVEDEALIALDLEQALIEEGFEPIVFATCKSGRKWLAVMTPEVAILDIMVTDGSCETIAKTLVERGVPFIVHSGAPAGHYAATPFSKGAWIPKPIGSLAISDGLRMLRDNGNGRRW